MITFIKILLVFMLLFTVFGCNYNEPTGTLTAVTITSINGTSENVSLHADTHAYNGTDIIEVTGLFGLLADDQHVSDNEVISAVEGYSGLDLTGTTILTPQLEGNLLTSGNHFDAGGTTINVISTGNQEGIHLRKDNIGGSGGRFLVRWDDPVPTNGDIIGNIGFNGHNTALNDKIYGYFEVISEDIATGSEDGRFDWYLSANGSVSRMMYLTSGGTLYVKGDYQTFDSHDDVSVLKRAISQNEIGLLVNLDIAKWRYESDNSSVITGYDVDVEKLIRLVAGGLIQLAERVTILEERINILEGK